MLNDIITFVSSVFCLPWLIPLVFGINFVIAYFVYRRELLGFFAFVVFVAFCVGLVFSIHFYEKINGG